MIGIILTLLALIALGILGEMVLDEFYSLNARVFDLETKLDLAIKDERIQKMDEYVLGKIMTGN